jgi:hypothetical protein
LREERRLRVSENRVLRRPKGDEVTGEWGKLHNEGLNDLYCSSNIIRGIKSRRKRWAGHVALWRIVTYRVVLEKSEGKRPRGITKRRWENNIKMDLQEEGSGALTGLIWFKIVTLGWHLYTR